MNRETQRPVTEERAARAAAEFDLHLLRVVVYALRRSTPVEAFPPRRARARFRQCLYRFDAELLAAAGTQSVHDQQYQIGVTDLLDAEGSAVTKQSALRLNEGRGNGTRFLSSREWKTREIA